jgi:hypothetical protein
MLSLHCPSWQEHIVALQGITIMQIPMKFPDTELAPFGNYENMQSIFSTFV